ncbi:MAG: class E sortase [Propionibacteriales bacterium]|nr:class E sortase [Propionibacteriales bacterium]
MTRSSTPARARRRGPSVITILGVVLLLAGVGVLGWIGYQYFGTNVVAEKTFEEQKTGLRQQWSTPEKAEPTTKIPGEALALLRIPRFGKDYEVPLIRGTELSVLNRGVGVYDVAAAPGEVGNFSIAGHRVTNGEPFKRLLELRKGDKIIVETRTEILTYVLDTAPADLTVSENDTWVLDPVPGKKDQKPTKELITLTTCQDLFRSPDRSIAFGHLESSEKK